MTQLGSSTPAGQEASNSDIGEPARLCLETTLTGIITELLADVKKCALESPSS